MDSLLKHNFKHLGQIHYDLGRKSGKNRIEEFTFSILRNFTLTLDCLESFEQQGRNFDFHSDMEQLSRYVDDLNNEIKSWLKNLEKLSKRELTS